jgi:hypothetical protein
VAGDLISARGAGLAADAEAEPALAGLAAFSLATTLPSLSTCTVLSSELECAYEHMKRRGHISAESRQMAVRKFCG